MAWNTPITWSSGAVVTKAQLDAQIRDNMNFQLNQKQIVRAYYNTTGNYSLASTVWALADSTNLSVAIGSAFQTGRVFVSFQFLAAISGSVNPFVGYFDVKADDGNYLSSGSTTPVEGINMLSNAGGDVTLPVLTYSLFNITGYFTSLSANAAHTFKLAYRTTNASNPITLFAKNNRASGISSIVMFAAEV